MASSVTGLSKKKNKPHRLSHRRLSGGRNTKHHHILIIRTTVTLLLLSLSIYNIFNVNVYLEEIDLAKVKDITTTTNNNNGHCIVVISKLYGNHTLSRVHKSLSWYKSITLESIRLATQHIGNSSYNDAFVAIMLSAEGSYATEATASLEGLKSINGMPDIHTNTTVMLNQHVLPNLLQECDVVSMVRIDADDMLLPDIFEYIIEGWRDINWRDEMKKSNSSGEGAMVIGGRLTTRITLVPPQSNGGEPRCLKRTQRNSYLSSAGISVTLPASVLFALKNKFMLCMSDHTKLPSKVRSNMKELGLHTLVEDKPLGVLTTTPLSGHFNQSYLGDNSTLPYCNENFLVSEFDDGDIGRLIWKARDTIPQWTQEEWRQNSFVKKGASWTRGTT